MRLVDKPRPGYAESKVVLADDGTPLGVVSLRNGGTLWRAWSVSDEGGSARLTQVAGGRPNPTSAATLLEPTT